MGIIGNDLLNRIEKAEEDGDWDLVLELLAMAQLNASKEYIRLVKEEVEQA